ncbi:LysR family transcriptional regulator, glycine cleavage system transcriptional activator [Microbulbifer donghaiensis]|uniref:LysR family transcriptional regulator, glycine cleavage system transcriptional activator n=1 Tax=Microbulbifer donghaiensis TaxID=494016 RepID=A0A1M4X0M9_9GAMM|nr:LysR substrate-binding domain-containing protein [Microbulbifer donghaiensis]SHE87066.1 LysR family transcriptional regulator, glycine cleavage system transcriptional activator [Microbulbifer donghaiensis]
MLSRRTLPLNALKAFEAAGRHLHMGRAAEELGVTHGAISHQVRALEQQLGVALFDRTGKTLSLTTSGRKLLRAVTEALDVMITGAENLEPDTDVAPLLVGCTPALAANWLSRAIGDFCKDFPELTVHFRPLAPGVLRLPTDIDVALCYGKPTSGFHHCDQLVEDHFFPVAHPSLVHGAGPLRSPNDLQQFRPLHDDSGSWDTWNRKYGTRSAVKALHFFDSSHALQAARAGLGVALAGAIEVAHDLRNGSLVRLLKDQVTAPQAYYLAEVQAPAPGNRVAEFCQWIGGVLSRETA